MQYYSPLRYPGGKSGFTPFILQLFEKNQLSIQNYFELYAGGAAVAIELLFNGHVHSITLNDADFHIYAFWKSILNKPDEFNAAISRTRISMAQWYRQRAIYESGDTSDEFSQGFATFFLNRTNRSGIISKTGPIGGYGQTGNYKIDARFNKKRLTKLIEEIAKRSNQIRVHNEDAIKLMSKLRSTGNNRNFTFLDPPYYSKGRKLYLNFYSDKDHTVLRNHLNCKQKDNWLVSYDNSKEISSLYQGFNKRRIGIRYSLQNKTSDKEILILSDKLEYPTIKRNYIA